MNDDPEYTTYLGSMFSRVLAAYNAVLVPTQLYGSETWVLQKKNEREKNAVNIYTEWQVLPRMSR